MRMRASACASLAVSLTAVAAPVVSPELPVAPAPVQDAPFPEFAAVGTDGTDFLMAWLSLHPDDGAGELMATRISAAGQVLDPTGVVVDMGTANLLALDGIPAVRFDGSRYWVLHGGLGISGALVPPDGGTASAVSLPSTQPGPCIGPRIAEGNGQWLIAWSDGSGGILGERMSAAGASLDARPITLFKSAGPRHGVAPAFDGTNYWVAWAEGTTPTGGPVVAVRVSSAGVVLDASPRSISAPAGVHEYPSTSCLGPTCLTAWCDSANVYQPAFAVTVSGVIVATGVVPPIMPDDFCSLVYASNDGTRFLLTWSSGDFPLPVGGVHVSIAGQVAEASPLVLTPVADGGLLGEVDYGPVFGGGQYLLAWADSASSNQHITLHASLLTADGGVLATQKVSRSPADQLFPGIASNGSGYLVTWWSDASGSALAAALVGLDGTSSGPIAGLPSDPDYNLWNFAQAGSNGTDFVIVSSSADAGAVAIRVAGDGGVVDGQPVQLWPGAPTSIVEAASNPPDYLMVWGTAGSATPSVYSATLGPTGPSAAAQTTPNSQAVSSWPAASGAAGGYWIAWPVASGGIVAALSGSTASPVNVLPSGAGSPALAFDGAKTLVVASGADGGVLAALLKSDGTFSPALTVSTDVASQVAAAGQAGEFIVLWETTAGAPALWGARVWSDGGLDTGSFPVTLLSPSPLQSSRVAVVAAGQGRYGLAYDRYDSTADAFGTYVRTLQTSPGTCGAACAPPQQYRIGCGCVAGPSTLTPLLVLVWAARRRQKPEGSRGI